MRFHIQMAALVAGLALAATSTAQAPGGAPAGTTGVCKDGTYSSAASKKGACSGHQGVQTWYGATSDSASPASATSAAAPSAAPATANRTAQATAQAPSSSTSGSASSPNQGSGPGQVWVNEKSKVYHCPGDRWYGKTKEGEYMSETDASAKGFRPDHGKKCS